MIGPEGVQVMVTIDREGVARVEFEGEHIVMTKHSLSRLLTEFLKSIQATEEEDDREVDIN